MMRCECGNVLEANDHRTYTVVHKPCGCARPGLDKARGYAEVSTGVCVRKTWDDLDADMARDEATARRLISERARDRARRGQRVVY
jgi:hypothetical protein